ncbi:hypothetical protein JHK87_042551 [Glycine soja]|nr:hypothetical protein JHK87_042551 [Glycine soja]
MWYREFDMQECIKVFLVKLPESRKFIVPKNMRLLAVPLCQVHENHKDLVVLERMLEQLILPMPKGESRLVLTG